MANILRETVRGLETVRIEDGRLKVERGGELYESVLQNFLLDHT